jgi:precorrin-6B methylase 2
MDPDLALVVEKLREVMTRVSKLGNDHAIPGLSEKLAPLADQIESLATVFAGAQPPAPPAIPKIPVAEPVAVTMEAFAAENSPPHEAIGGWIVDLLSTARPVPVLGGRRGVIEDFSAEYEPGPESGESLRRLEAGTMPASLDSGTYALTESDIEETPAAVIAALLHFARVAARDVVYNLGCGDGRLLVSAASRHGARGIGIDDRSAAVEAAREKVRKGRLTQLVAIDEGNSLTADISSATVVFLSLGGKNNAMMEALLRQPGMRARIVTHQGGLTNWRHDLEQVVQDDQGRHYRFRLWGMTEPQAGGPNSSVTNLSDDPSSSDVD